MSRSKVWASEQDPAARTWHGSTDTTRGYPQVGEYRVGCRAAPARQTHGVAGPERLVPQNVCSPVRPHYAVSTMTAPYFPVHGSITVRSSPQFSPRHDVLVHGVHHHARQQRRLWPIRPVGPSAFTVTTTPLCCTPLCLGSTAHDDEPDHSSKMETGSLVKDGNRITRQTGPAARSRASSSGSDHRCRDHWRCQGCRGRRC